MGLICLRRKRYELSHKASKCKKKKNTFVVANFCFFFFHGGGIFFVVCFDFPEGLAAVAVSEVSAANGRTF